MLHNLCSQRAILRSVATDKSAELLNLVKKYPMLLKNWSASIRKRPITPLVYIVNYQQKTLRSPICTGSAVEVTGTRGSAVPERRAAFVLAPRLPRTPVAILERCASEEINRDASV